VYHLLLSWMLACNGDKDAEDTATDGDADTDADADTDTDTDTDADTDADADVFQVVAEGLPNAVMSVWMSSTSDVWLVGADGGTDPAGPMVAHYDGTAWTDVDPPMTGKLQWVWSDGADTVVMVGAGAQVLTHRIAADTWEVTAIGDPRYTLWGVWGSSADDLWAVAGDSFGNLNGAIFHFDGTAWTLAYDAPTDKIYQIFKVWGAAADDVWAVGNNGFLAHYDGTAWSKVASPSSSATMFTVHGASADQVYAAGGFANATIWAYDGAVWQDDSPPPQSIPPKMTGVFAHPTHGAASCGNMGSVWWRDEATGEWAADPRPPVTTWNFHACWIDEAGGVWAVGGNIDSPALDNGVVIYGGPETIAPL
jgi:hypothetical protein